MKLKLLILINDSWSSLPAKVKAVQDMFNLEVDFTVTTQETDFEAIPFTDYNVQKRIDNEWYQKNITPLAIGYDCVAFIVPTRQWLANNNVWGFKTFDKPIGQIEIGCDEKQIFQFPGEEQKNAFIYFLGHELRHYLMQFTTKKDYDPTAYPGDDYYVHFLDRIYKSKAPEQFLKELDFARPNTADKTYGWLLAIINFLKAFTDLKPDQEAQIREVAESYNPQPHISRLWDFASAIQSFEGWWPGSVSYRNQNPGNIKFANQSKAIGKDKQGHAIFASYKDGWDALIYQLKIIANGTSNAFTNRARSDFGIKNCGDLNIFQFCSIYAEKNYANYATSIATKLGVPQSTKIKTLL